MNGEAATELMLIRHAPALHGGRLCGRTDVPADCSDTARIAAVRAALGSVDRILASPARRCLETAQALWPDRAAPAVDDGLWEQDFGSWDGLPLDQIPDLGPLNAEQLAAHRPPGGESFTDLCARVAPILGRSAGAGRVAVVAHAGTVRAGLAFAFGTVAPALGFEVAPLSITRLRHLPGGGWSIGAVNWVPL